VSDQAFESWSPASSGWWNSTESFCDAALLCLTSLRPRGCSKRTAHAALQRQLATTVQLVPSLGIPGVAVSAGKTLCCSEARGDLQAGQGIHSRPSVTLRALAAKLSRLFY